MPAGGDRQGGGKIGYNHLMKTKLIFLLSLTFLFLYSGSVFGKEEVDKDFYGSGKLRREVP